MDALFTGCAVADALISAASVPVSLANLWLLAPSPLVHPNLKRVLLFQSTCLLMRSVVRLCQSPLHFVLGSFVAGMRAEPLHTAYTFATYSRTQLAHLIMAERAMATLLRRSYECRSSWPLAFAWATALIGLSAYNAYIRFNSPTLNTTLTNLVFGCASAAAGAVELALYLWLQRYNEHKYKQRLQSATAQKLSEEYQLSENIRIGKQLLPTILLLLLGVAATAFYQNWAYFGMPCYDYLVAAVTLLASVDGLLIEVTMILCHPFLKRDLVALLRRWRGHLCGPMGGPNAARVHPLVDGPSPSGALATRDILSGRDLTAAGSPGEHFAVLHATWQR